MSPVRIVGLEEHFVIPGLLQAWGKLPPDRRDLAFRPAAEGDTGRRLLELGPERIAAMDATGLSVQVLSLTTPGVQNLPARQAVALAQRANDLLAAAVRARPDRFQGLAALPTSAPGAAAEEFERALTGLGLDGAMIFGRTGPQHLDHADLWPVYEVAERRSAPLHLHPQSPAPAVRNAYYSGFGPAVEAAFATFGVGWHYDAGVEFLRMVVAGVFDRSPGCRSSSATGVSWCCFSSNGSSTSPTSPGCRGTCTSMPQATSWWHPAASSATATCAGRWK